ncbi:MAG: transposase [Deltaproteobacteria bacterium]|nr:transposase [Deltaproteobacteria bacterium]MBW2100983.1 transposase [Deltaproteobacteria bacterium]
MSISEIKQILEEINIRPDATENEFASEAVFALLQLVERLNKDNEWLKIENQNLRDAINLLKGEQGKPTVLGKTKGKQGNISSEKERKKREIKEKPKSKAKKDKIKVNRNEICKIDKSILPEDAVFKGYETTLVQEILITTDNVEYSREKYYSPSQNKIYLGNLPIGVTGEFGPCTKTLVYTLKYSGNMSQPKIEELLANCGISISQSTISRILTNDEIGFGKEKEDIFLAALASTPYHQVDDTTVRVNGENHYSQIFCNPFYTAFFTVPHKDRLTILDILLCGKERTYLFDSNAFDLLSEFNISQKIIGQIMQLKKDGEMSEEEMQEMLGKLYPKRKKGKNNKKRILEAGAIAAYHQQTDIPVIDILLSDDAPQFKKLTAAQALCWVHDGRHYNRLNPIVPLNVEILDKFKTRFWDFYGELLKYKTNPTPEKADILSADFDRIFSTKTGYEDLDDRIEKTGKKKEALLLVLKHPELPLHNNASELAARVEKRRQDVSLQTKSKEGTDAKDAFLTVAQTAKKLGVNIYKYIADRISKKFNMPSLAELITQNFLPQIE